jgi:hypothetical protein
VHLDILHEISIHFNKSSLSLCPNYLYDKIGDSSYNEVYDGSYNHPPCPFFSFHQNFFSHSIQDVHLDQRSITLSTKTFVISLMQSLYDELVFSTKLFTNYANIPTKMSPQQIVLLVQFVTTVTAIVAEYASRSATIYH